MVKSLPTRFAPAQRAKSSTLRHQIDFFSHRHITRHLLDAIPSQLVILNEQRQIVYANGAMLQLAGVENEEQLHGLRLGEALDCVNAAAAEGGCGTTENCSTCGAVLGALAGLGGKKGSWECRMTRCPGGKSEALDLKIDVTPLDYRGTRFAVIAVSDISHEKRRRALERIFFHDVLNVASSIKGFAELLLRYDPSDRQEYYSLIHSAADQVVEEIDAQRMLQAAETNELRLNLEPLATGDFLGLQLEIYRHHEVAEGRLLRLDPRSETVTFQSDRTLLGRVLGNMIKNALEASTEGETVSVGCRPVGSSVEFWVHNQAVIPPQAQLQIFQRSFSTKGSGRGLGTYSMKLLSERLGGEVSFSSSEKEGTVFRARYPRAPG